MKDRRGILSLGDLAPAAVAFVVIAVTIGIGATVLGTIQDDQTINSTAYNSTGQGLEGLDQLGSFLPTIAVVVAAAVVIGTIAFLRS